MLEPLWARVLVFPHTGDEEEDEGGFELTEGSKDRPTRGTVLAHGAGHRNSDGSVTPLKVQVDDVVVFNKFSGIKVTDETDDDKQLVVLQEDEILCIERSPATS
jgi:chaperonin GroES